MDSGLEIRQLRAFLAMVDHGTVTAAAQALGLAQSTVSEGLSALERALGTPVFLRRRGSRDLLLTDAGSALVPHARQVLAQIDAAHVAVAGTTNGARSSMSIATNESVSSYILTSPLAALRRAWPNTTFEVSVMLCTIARRGVEAGTYDAAVILQPIEDDTTPANVDRTILSEQVGLVVFAQPDHPLVAGGRRTVPREALSAYTLYLTDAADDFPLLVRHFLQGDGLPGPHLQPTGSVESVKRAVAGDLRALGLLPGYALLDELRSGKVAPLSVTPSSPRMRLEAHLSRKRARHPAAKELVEALVAKYAAIDGPVTQAERFA